MSRSAEVTLGINSWLEDELQQYYRHDPAAVDPSWRERFAHEARVEPRTPGPAAAASPPVAQAGSHEGELVPLRGVAGRIAENMNASLTVPTATSQRTIPVKVVEENRRIIHEHRELTGRGKVSYTHLIAWAVVQALKEFPVLNHAYVEKDGQPYRLVRSRIHLGIAVDVAGKDGSRALLVPNIKDAGSLDFRRFLDVYDDLIVRARSGKLSPEDFQGTTVSLTNPGTVGTVASVPRLMAGQGAIIATGVIDYPAEYRGVAPEVRAMLGIGKVMTITCTYDHRIIQGAESGLFLARVQALLEGADGFYDRMFADLGIPHRPVRWEPDRQACLPGAGDRLAEVAKEAAVLQLINAYRVRGHLLADLDPLGSAAAYHPELDPATYGLTIWDLDRPFITGTLAEALGHGGPQPVATLREILETLRRTYCGKIGCEYMHIQVPEQKRWLQQRMEPQANQWPLERETRLRILDRLLEAEALEHFLHARFVGHKRFSLEGAESAIPMLDELLFRACALGVEEAVIGMAHRGRLNVLANIVGKPVEQILSQFEMQDPESIQGSGDVKYHLGASGLRAYPNGRSIAVTVVPNPSHLEAVDPVVEGVARSKQSRRGPYGADQVLPVLIHGDAAFAGQGVVAETLNLSQLEGYWTGGTVHIVINNQIGFTTPPKEARSSVYATDVARMVQAPIFHVNGDDPEACLRAIQVAFEFRQRFHRDVVVDMFCYRRHGHNESDDPSYTQPVMYRKIREHPSVTTLYARRLIEEGLVSEEELDRKKAAIGERLARAYRAAQEGGVRFEMQEIGPLRELAPRARGAETAAGRDVLEQVVHGLARLPEGFRLHPKLRAFLERREQVFREGGPVDWALAEALAFGSLVLEGVPVRLSGQDSARGTFSQRHAILYDYEDGSEYCPLKHLAPGQASFEVYDSLLSENAVLGFEFGYSIADPHSLVIWEAQFGDFANGAQVVIDQFIAASEDKWGQPSGLVLLLPHGYEGQGPEHSSARIERFLQLAAAGNIQVAFPSTPAQYFHLLRRQMFGAGGRPLRKPLIVFTPKSLLRHTRCVSRVEELISGTFREVLPGATPADPEAVARLLLCTGKIFYELEAERERLQATQVAIVRIEQLYPFPHRQVHELLESFPATAEVAWVQEEPRNMGAWRFVQEQVQPLLAASRRLLEYVGRPESPSPATGSYKRHLVEQREVIERAFLPVGGFSRLRRAG
ncbi:MAG: multifunctional oxoglutarate decarboxylase/oxoglutarate dehydrogenase thiamine pyrophosphate-binding subunit/dihydrolipoyllysine-residue succinyltransferase subunit [Bryobacterales bacterium]|nr:multifunctional oxoglutarate decarboxylase/oxoglutarate dehydrogenase thiamine pyrophosphate-binding subunit/dihydrolipoyllysine-residue succinyltransferase subunit [Bryobacteraceae bacterium]MDW8129249.1 multifunctional oxoglutarate decarboxylase/oxoglutarate dehydrogenase thiamine pyrophosphate-binding subunit/dihydrolipoyllysine-residue succinyltransferase subunit [Bryobacterales bacterium]